MSISLDDGTLRVSANLEHGFVVTELAPAGVGNVLWTRPNRTEAALPERADAVSATDDFDEHVFIGGWFGMFPTAGIPALTDSDRVMHGDLSRVRWSVEAQDALSVTASAWARPGFRMRRSVTVQAGALHVATEVQNVTADDQMISFGEHPCLARAVFAGGRISMDAVSLRVPEERSEPAAARLLPGQQGQWPLALGIDGAQHDISRIPAASDGSHDHVALEVAKGVVSVESPAHRGRLEFGFDSGLLPHVLLWRHFQPPATPWGGDVFSAEAMSTPGRSLQDPGAREALRLIPPDGRFSWQMSAVWKNSDLVNRDPIALMNVEYP